MPPDTTNISIHDDIWRELRARKDPGDSFNDVLRELLDEVAERDAIES